MNQVLDFLCPRLVGKRFEEHAIPLEVLKDFAALEEMVNEVAKWHFLNDHSSRERIPRGFTEGISIRLKGLEEGSVIPKLVLVIASHLVGLLPPANQLYFEKARESIISSVDAAEHNENIRSHLPDSMLSYFDKIGRSLKDDEYIEFRPANPQRPARLNKETRKRLVLTSSQTQFYTEEILIKGFIPEADQGKSSFTIELIDGERISALLDPMHKETIIEVFNKYSDKQKVSIKGVGRFNRYEKLQKIESIEYINIIDELDISDRLEDLSKLKDGWLDGKGIAPSAGGLKWLDETFGVNYESSLPLPHLYPTAEGGIQAEWALNNWEISLDINIASKIADFQGVNLKTHEEEEGSYDLSKTEAWDAINSAIRNKAGTLA